MVEIARGKKRFPLHQIEMDASLGGMSGGILVEGLNELEVLLQIICRVDTGCALVKRALYESRQSKHIGCTLKAESMAAR